MTKPKNKIKYIHLYLKDTKKNQELKKKIKLKSENDSELNGVTMPEYAVLSCILDEYFKDKKF